ncbi:MAG TPA: L,D-transpeptidase [Solirubrobacteraceae bacterium]|nr:L,D-transpeptidase [Solirubrobacteraceae bacterium]
MAGEHDGRQRLLSRRALLVSLALLVPGIPIAVGVAIGLQKPTAGAAATTTSESLTPAAPTAGATAAAAELTLPAIPGGSGALVALLLHPTNLRSSPRGHTIARLRTKTEFGSPEMLWVVIHRPGWLGVMTPQAGNGRVAWISQSATSLSRVPWELKVSLGSRRLTVLDHGRVVERYAVAIGASKAPTPTGRFAVTDRLVTNDPSGPYGCCILALSASAPHAIQGWTGGTRIAIHSTPESGSIGEAASHGCVRVTLAEGRWLLAHIPLGTPALISS